MFFLTGLAWMALAQQGPLDNSAYVEANRPHMAPRTLRADELKVMRSLVTRRPDDVTIAALRPYAEAGNIEALQAVVLGYVGLRDQSKMNDFGSRIGRPSDKYTALAGVWAAQLWQSKRDYTKDYGRLIFNAIGPCLGDVPLGADYQAVVTRTGTRKTYDCGFDTLTSASQLNNFPMSGKSKDGGAGPFQFIFRPVKPQSEIDARRLTRVMRKLRGQLPGASPAGVWEDTLDEADLYWASEYAHANPEAFPEWVDADFARALIYARDGKRLTPGTSTWLYMKADLEREKIYAYRLSLHASELAGDRQLFLAQIDGATFGDRKRLHDIAVREGGDLAERWFRKFGSGLLGSELSVIGWCNIGANSACGPATQEVQRLEYLRKSGTPAAAGPSGYVAPDLQGQLEAFKKREADINRGNCARASLGASIICNR